jgi:mannosyl-3-phosphoglycerate phosphatase
LPFLSAAPLLFARAANTYSLRHGRRAHELVNRLDLVIVSDLDGTLLDHDTYSMDAALPALDRLQSEGVPLVFCTSKTRAEIEPLREAIGNTHPFIVENGGGVFVPQGYFPFRIDGAEQRGSFDAIVLGDRYEDLVQALGRASIASGVPVRGFSDMSDDEVATETGLAIGDARAARQREFDEPFVILAPDREQELGDAIEREGKRWTRGGRFHHVVGGSDKARATLALLALYQRRDGTIRSVGLGDAPNDAPFLNVVDVPVLIRSPRVERLRALVPHGMITAMSGPAGWNDTVLAILDDQR